MIWVTTSHCDTFRLSAALRCPQVIHRCCCSGQNEQLGLGSIVKSLEKDHQQSAGLKCACMAAVSNQHNDSVPTWRQQNPNLFNVYIMTPKRFPWDITVITFFWNVIGTSSTSLHMIRISLKIYLRWTCVGTNSKTLRFWMLIAGHVLLTRRKISNGQVVETEKRWKIIGNFKTQLFLPRLHSSSCFCVKTYATFAAIAETWV